MLRPIFLNLVVAILVMLNHVEFSEATAVIIIGAGIAGITAGKQLADHRMTDIIILEARAEIGGRMQTHDFGGIQVEKGANWIEGVNGKQINPILNIANEIKLVHDISIFDNISSNIYDASGILTAELGAERCKKSLDSTEFTTNLSGSMTIANQKDVSVLTAQRLYGRVPATPVEMVLDYYNYDYEFAEPPKVTSLKNTQPLPTFHNFGEDIYFVHDPRGYKAVVHHLAESYLVHSEGVITDPRLQLNKVVRKVEYTNYAGAKVTTEDGSVYNADRVIVSVSLGVLQSQLIDFVPDLPFWKLKALYTFDMAVYTKIFLKFPYKFWNSNNGTKFWLYADERRGYYPVWQHLDSEFPGVHALLVTVTDEESHRIEQQSDNETLGEIMDVLKTMFGENVPMADAIFVPRWWSDRLFRGSFSNWPVDVDSNVFKQLQAPVQNIYFTGEHTSESYNGYVHGGYLSGIDTANAILDCKIRQKGRKCSNRPEVSYERLSEECSNVLDKDRDMQKNMWAKKAARFEKELAEAKIRH